MSFKNPYLAIIRKLRRNRVCFLVVGVFGINHYATSPGLEFSTLDCDLLVKPDPNTLLKTLHLLESAGYALEFNGESLGKPDLWLAKKIIQHRASISAVKDKFVRIDVLTHIAGYSFKKLYRARRLFKAGKTLVPVASLEHLLMSKKKCGRKKDIEFLRLYTAAIREEKKRQFSLSKKRLKEKK